MQYCGVDHVPDNEDAPLESSLVPMTPCTVCGQPDQVDLMYTGDSGLICDQCQMTTELVPHQHWSPIQDALAPLPWFVLWLPDSYSWLTMGTFGPHDVFMSGSALWVLWAPIWLAGLLAGPLMLSRVFRTVSALWTDSSLESNERLARLGGQGWYLLVMMLVLGMLLTRFPI